MSFPVFDLHCDTAYKLCGDSDIQVGLRQNDFHIDLKRAGELPGYVQCFACFTTPLEDGDPVLAFERQLSVLLREFNSNAHFIRQVFSAKDIEKNQQDGLMSAILTLEGPAGIGFDPGLLEDLYKIGFRISTLGWNESNPLTGSQITGEGLTDRGICYVREAQRLGMLVDVSHISDAGFWDVMDITDAPVIATHSNSRYIWDVKRNLTDEMFLEICNTGGLVGINLYSDFLGANPTLDTVCDHIFHFIELDPDGRHIALGGDLDGCDCLPAGFKGIQSYPLLADKLLRRGLDESAVSNIFWNNAMGVLNNAVCNHQR